MGPLWRRVHAWPDAVRIPHCAGQAGRVCAIVLGSCPAEWWWWCGIGRGVCEHSHMWCQRSTHVCLVRQRAPADMGAGCLLKQCVRYLQLRQFRGWGQSGVEVAAGCKAQGPMYCTSVLLCMLLSRACMPCATEKLCSAQHQFWSVAPFAGV